MNNNNNNNNNNDNPNNYGTGPNIRIPSTTQHIRHHCHCLKATPNMEGQTAAIRHKLLCILLKIHPALLILPAELTQSINMVISVQTKVQ